MKKIYDDGECQIYQSKNRFTTITYYVNPYMIVRKGGGFGGTVTMYKGEKSYFDTLAELEALVP